MKNKIKNIGFILCVLMVLTIKINVKAIKVMECDYTNEFKKYMKLSNEEKKNAIVPTICKTQVGYIAKESSTIPSKYDLRNIEGKSYITSVKDQFQTNACWTFATNASIESNLLKKGKEEYDLSESHMEFFTQNTNSFLNTKAFNRAFNSGGNYYNSSVYLNNYYGSYKEEDSPFNLVINAVRDNLIDTSISFDNTKKVIDVDNVFLYNDVSGACSDNEITMIKNYIMKNGAIGTLFKIKDTLDHVTGVNFYNSDTNSTTDHAVVIAGWDDNYSKNNFKTTPTRDGAWLVKNSWGTVTENGVSGIDGTGYYYVSYDDVHICNNLGGFYNVDTKRSDNVYYHDYLGYVGTINFPYAQDHVSIKTRFESKNREKIDKIMFYISEFNQSYEVYIADKNGNKKLIKTGVSEYPGYNSVVLDDDIHVVDGEFYIIVSYKTVDSVIPVPLAYAFGTDSFTLYSNYQVSYQSEVEIDGTWRELLLTTNDGSFDADSTIRVFTSAYDGDESVDPSDNEENENKEEEKNENKEEIILEENPNNEGSYIISDENVSNPKTANSTAIVFYVIISVLLMLIIVSSIRLNKIKNNM